jgi:hypothetical protein
MSRGNQNGEENNEKTEQKANKDKKEAIKM